MSNSLITFYRSKTLQIPIPSNNRTICPVQNTHFITPQNKKEFQQITETVKEQPVQEYLTDSSGILGQIILEI